LAGLRPDAAPKPYFPGPSAGFRRVPAGASDQTDGREFTALIFFVFYYKNILRNQNKKTTIAIFKQY
jgi:hypothetical protein